MPKLLVSQRGLVITLVLLLFMAVAVIAKRAEENSAAPAAVEPLTRNECLDLGFQSDSVQCGDCNLLLEHVNDLELHSECTRCCTADTADSSSAAAEKYVLARLELDYRMVHPGSEWEKFFNDVLPTFNDRVVPFDTPRMPARLVMENADGEQHVVRISTWSVDLVRDYLKNKLLPVVSL